MRPGFSRRRGLWLAFIVFDVLVIAGVVAAILITRGGGSSATGTTGTTASSTTTPAASVSVAVSTAVESIARASAIVPSVVGEQRAAAEARLHDLGFDALARTQASPHAKGVVLDQNPTGGTRLQHGALVGLVVSAGQPNGVVPAVVGLPVADALAKVHDAGLGARVKPVRARVRAGLVAAQTPAAGGKPASGDVVLSVSLGPGRTTVPDVVGTLRAEAVQKLVAAGLAVGFKAVPSQKPPGTVLAQSPTGGASVPRGSTVHLRVVAGAASSAGGAIAVPDVKGRLQVAAQAILHNAGLKAHIVHVHSLQAVGAVVGEGPRPGTQVSPGTSVELSISSGPGP